MYNPMLDTFIAVSNYGSFTKAAEHLYISPTAVMKQMNALESHLNLKLIERTPSGVHITPAGEVIYRDAKFMIDYSKKSIAAANTAMHTYDTTFCVGTSLLNPAKPFMDLWYKVNQSFPDYKLHLVPFEDNHEGILSEIEKLGEKFDFLIGVCDSKVWLSLCHFLPLGRYKKMIAVSREHPLASKSRIDIKDLYGETLMMVSAGDSGVNDFIRNDLKKITRRFILKTRLTFMIYLYLTAVQRPEMFCLRLNVGRKFILVLSLSLSIGIIVFLLDFFTAFMRRRMC